MNDIAAADPVLVRLKDELQRMYGSRLERLLLYGSRARGDYQEDSDYDVLVVLKPPMDRWKELDTLSSLSSDIAIESAGTVILSLRPVTDEQVQERTGFMHNVRREAVAI